MDLRAQGERILGRFQTLEQDLQNPDLVKNIQKLTDLNREYSELKPLVEGFTRYFKVLDDISGGEAVLADPTSDSDFRDLAKEEINAAKGLLPGLTEELKRLLLPKDADDQRNVILEIRGGTGGDEA